MGPPTLQLGMREWPMSGGNPHPQLVSETPFLNLQRRVAYHACAEKDYGGVTFLQSPRCALIRCPRPRLPRPPRRGPSCRFIPRPINTRRASPWRCCPAFSFAYGFRGAFCCRSQRLGVFLVADARGQVNLVLTRGKSESGSQLESEQEERRVVS